VSAHMSLRDLYLPAGASLDLAAAKAVADTLCRSADVTQLRVLLEHDRISHPALYHWDPTDEQISAHLSELRATAVQRLHWLLDEFAASLRDREVVRFPFDRDNGGGHTVDGYATGGVTPSDAPTDSWEAWDIVHATDEFPPGWCDQLGAAFGLLHPLGTGPAAATVQLYRWGAIEPDGSATTV
jgi:hypothetical protein